MPATSPTPKPAWLIWGDDDYSVKTRARSLFSQWCDEAGNLDQEIIDASASNAGEALAVINRFLEALQSLPFFGSLKLIWLKNCNFLGDDRTAAASAVTEKLGLLAESIKNMPQSGVRILISAGKVDRRRTWYKTLESNASIESFPGISISDRDWAARTEVWASKRIKALQKNITPEALSQLVAWIGPDLGHLNNEIEKIFLYSGKRTQIDLTDIEAVVTHQKQARAFALGDALGNRDLPRALKALDEELWELQIGSQKSEIGLLYGLISKVRILLLLKEMIREGLVRPETDYNRFKSQLEKIQTDQLPSDKRFNPLASNPYILFRALPQTRRFTQAELLHAMDLLLECNYQLISSDLDEALALQHTLIQIIGLPSSPA